MFQQGRRAFALLALSAAVRAFAAGALPPELESLHARAENGNAIAQYNLGLAYAYGRGVPVDRVEAFVWLSLAVEQGTTGKDLDSLQARMSPDELTAAQQHLSDVRSTIAVAAPTSQAYIAPASAQQAPAPSAPAPTAPSAPSTAQTPAPAAAAQPTPVPTVDPQIADLQGK